MSVAAIYDIHGNLPALEAVLQEIAELQVDALVAGGDVIVGPMSAACLDLLLDLQLPVHFILGNCEVAVLNQMDDEAAASLPESVLKDVEWTAGQLLPSHRAAMAGWPKTLSLMLPRLGSVLFCHATPRDENEIFTKQTDDRILREVFAKTTADLVVCGHTHMQFDRTVGHLRVVNAGSVGMPFGEPGAFWLLLNERVELRRTNYDLASAADRISSTAYPHAHDFAENNVLSPPSEAEMLEIFRQAELRV